MSVFSFLRPMAVSAALAFGALPASAGVLYDCKMVTKIVGGWVSPRVNIVVDDAGKVTVIDSISLYFLEKPAVGKLRRSGGNLRVTWSIPAARDSRGQRIPTIRYIAEIKEASGAINVIAKLTGAPQRRSAKGACATKSS